MRKRQGGHEHEYWRYRIAEFLKRKGYEVKIEQPIGEGKSVDVVASRNGENIALEIETGKSNLEENIQKNLLGDFLRIIIVPLNARAKDEIYGTARGLPICDSHKIKVLGLKELFLLFSSS